MRSILFSVLLLSTTFRAVFADTNCDHLETESIIESASDHSLQENKNWLNKSISSCRNAINACLSKRKDIKALKQRGFKRIPFTSFSWMVAKNMSNPLNVLESLRKKYGEYSYISFPFVDRIWLFTSDYSATKHVLKNTDRGNPFEKSDIQSHSLYKTLGRDNTFLGKGAAWQKRRSVFQKIFTRSYIEENHFSEMERIVDKHIARITKLTKSNSSEVNVSDQLTYITMDLALQRILGIEVSVSDIQSKYSPAFKTMMKWLTTEAISPLHTSLAKLPTILSSQKEYREAMLTLNELADRVLAQRPRSEFVSILFDLKGSKPNQSSLSHQEMRNEVLTILLAGHETTSTMLEWSIKDIIENPKSHSELSAQLRNNGKKKFDSIEKMEERCPFLALGIKESSRLNSPAYVIMRRVAENTSIPMDNGSSVPVTENMEVIINSYGLHRNQKVFGTESTGYDANVYEPKRFLSKTLQSGRAKYMPFGHGARQCLGAHFATIESQLILAKMFENFKFDTNGNKFERTSDISARIKGGLRAKMRPIRGG